MINDFVVILKDNQKKLKLMNDKENISTIKHMESIKKNEEILYSNQNLFSLKEVNSNYINSLNSIDIYSIKELRYKAHTKEEIEVISKKTGIRKKLLDEWVRLGEFSRIQGIRQEHINLFEKVDINTVHELKKMDPEELYMQLLHLKKQGMIDSDIPTIGMISRWIRVSQKTPDRILNN